MSSEFSNKKNQRKRSSPRKPKPPINTSPPKPVPKLTLPEIESLQQQFQQVSEARGSVHPLAHSWIFWYHDDPNDWSLTSYHPIWKFSTIEGFWAFENNRASFADCYILLMKEGHRPIWEVPENQDGGSWGFRFPKKVADEQWKQFCLYLIGESMANENDQLVGLSMSPKIYNVTLRVWNKNSETIREKVKFREEILRHKHVYKEFRDHKD